MNKTLIYIDNLERYAFYTRVMDVLKDDELFIILTNKFSVYLKIKEKYKCYLLKKQRSTVSCSKNLEQTLSVACNYHTLEKAQEISAAVNTTLLNITKQKKLKMVFVFNGTTTIGKTVGDFCKIRDIPIKFIEISNISNKLFVDVKGTNAKSYVYDCPQVLDDYKVDDSEFKKWKEKYIRTKSAPKQAKNKTKIRYMMLLDYFGYYFLNTLQEDFRNPFKVLKNKLLNRRAKEFPKYPLDDKYIFFPMQVSNDSQIILNSDIDNIEAINIIKKEYPLSNIFIKPHPAEENSAFIREVEAMQNDNVKIVANDTNELITKAKKVITINSTVGLEAMILHKDVEVLGRALYTNFTYERLKSYICRYLINIDYFDGNILKEEAQRLYE